MNVWSYWEGRRPHYIDVCIESMRKVCEQSTYTLVTPENLDQYLDVETIHTNFRGLPASPTYRANVYRAALLAKHGGLWVDADTIGLQDPVRLLELYSEDASVIYAQWTNLPLRVMNERLYLLYSGGGL